MDISDQLEDYARVQAENEAKAKHWAAELDKLRKQHAGAYYGKVHAHTHTFLTPTDMYLHSFTHIHLFIHSHTHTHLLTHTEDLASDPALDEESDDEDEEEEMQQDEEG